MQHISTTDSAGALKKKYTYSSYGKPDSAGGQSLRYTGRRWDAETGLYYYRARYYSPAIGRFLQTDPIGYADNLNLYAYVGNDPMNATDPSGLGADLPACEPPCEPVTVTAPRRSAFIKFVSFEGSSYQNDIFNGSSYSGTTVTIINRLNEGADDVGPGECIDNNGNPCEEQLVTGTSTPPPDFSDTLLLEKLLGGEACGIVGLTGSIAEQIIAGAKKLIASRSTRPTGIAETFVPFQGTLDVVVPLESSFSIGLNDNVFNIVQGPIGQIINGRSQTTILKINGIVAFVHDHPAAISGRISAKRAFNKSQTGFSDNDQKAIKKTGAIGGLVNPDKSIFIKGLNSEGGFTTCQLFG